LKIQQQQQQLEMLHLVWLNLPSSAPYSSSSSSSSSSGQLAK
jgi:hypothetical protein